MAMRSSARRVLHLDLDAFYCAVEEQINPELGGKPFAVGGSPQGRGVVSSCSYAARTYGIRSAMPMAQAIRLCPELITVRGHYKEYGKRSREVMRVLKDFSQKIEQISIDEAFLDVSSNTIPEFALAQKLQKTITQETNLPASIGIASNKLVAKIATDVGKKASKTGTYPNAIQIVADGDEAAFLAPFPTEMLWGVGPKTAKHLNALGIYTIGMLASWPLEDLVNRLGQHGYDLHRRAKGIDNREITPYREAKSFSQETTFSADIADKRKLQERIRKQSYSVADSLKKGNKVGNTIKIKLRWPDFTTITRQVTLPAPTNDPKIIFEHALVLFHQNWRERFPVRLIGVGVSGLQAPSPQLSLWDAAKLDYEKMARLESAIQTVQNKFGPSSLQQGFHTIDDIDEAKG